MSDARVFMLNALWFRADGGEAKYAEYAAAAGPFVAALGGKLVQSYVPDLAVIGEWDPDLLFFVEWPTWDAFLALGRDSGYRQIAHLRDEAIEKSLLIRCRNIALPLRA